MCPSVTRVKQRKVEKSKVKRERRENAQMPLTIGFELTYSQFDTDFNLCKIIPEHDQRRQYTNVSLLHFLRVGRGGRGGGRSCTQANNNGQLIVFKTRVCFS